MVVIVTKINKFEAGIKKSQKSLLMMKKEEENYIYAYDDEAHQIIVIDAETGEKIERKENRSLAVVSHLHDEGEDAKLRKFILWCTYETNDEIKPMQRKFIEIAEEAIQEQVDPEKLEELYSESEGEAIATDTVGLQQGSLQASRECVNPDPFEGAKNAARFHCLWGTMHEKESKTEKYGQKINPDSEKTSTIKEIEQKQVDYLLDLIAE